MLSNGPNLLNCFIGSSDPLDGLVIAGPALFFCCGLAVVAVCDFDLGEE